MTGDNTIFVTNSSSRQYSNANEFNLENASEINSKNSKLPSEYKILIVEDNEELIHYLESILGASFELFNAHDGKEGLKMMYDIHPDLVITDLMMPEMDGLTMTEKIKKDFSISHIPVVMLTAKSTLDDQIKGIETGEEAYVLKPFSSEYLLSIVNNLLKQREILAKKFLSKSYSTDIKITDKDEEFIKNAIKIIEENFQNPNFNVNEMIEKSNLGRTVFFNKIKGLTGLSPIEFIRKIKLQIACKYLEENNDSVTEAAYFSGFNDVKYFAKCFKNEYGMNPSEYIKKIRMDAAE